MACCEDAAVPVSPNSRSAVRSCDFMGRRPGDGEIIFLGVIFDKSARIRQGISLVPIVKMRFLKASVGRSFFCWARSFARNARDSRSAGSFSARRSNRPSIRGAGRTEIAPSSFGPLNPVLLHSGEEPPAGEVHTRNCGFFHLKISVRVEPYGLDPF